MNWQVKAWTHRVLSALPESFGNQINHQLQKRIGRLRKLSAQDYVQPAKEYLEAIHNAGKTCVGKTFFELGTGRRLTTPLVLWLCGAEAVISVDLNRLLDEKCFLSDLRYMSNNHTTIRQMLGDFVDDELFQQRFAQLCKWAAEPAIQVGDILSETRIDYRSPADAGNLDLPDESVDYHVSITVLEHVPQAHIVRILNEARRILHPDGLLLHYIDYSDHFAFVDPGISRIHFVRFSEIEWNRWAGNRFAYHNRLRSDDFETLFMDAGFRLIANAGRTDAEALAQLKSGQLPVDVHFASKSPEVIACTDAFIVAALDAESLYNA